MKQYTVISARTRDIRFSDDPNEVPQHLCYHHTAHVTAKNPITAEEICRADTLDNWNYQTLVMFEGHLTALTRGHRVLHHSYVEKACPDCERIAKADSGISACSAHLATNEEPHGGVA